MRNNCLCYACNGSVCRKSNIVENFGHFTAFYGNTTVTNLEGPLAGKQLSDLLNSMHSMEVYVNFHTTEYPDGNTTETNIKFNKRYDDEVIALMQITLII